MPGLSPEMSAQLQEYVNASRAPRAGTWASPDTAPLAAPMPQEVVPVGAPALAVPPPVVVAPPGDTAALVAPVTAPAPAVAPAPPVDLPAASQAAVTPTTQVEAAELPAPPRNMAEAQARSSQATAQAADAMRAEGDVRAQGMDADAALVDQQVSEQQQLEAEGKRQRDERQADYDESVNQLKFAQEQNNRLNQITDRRTTTQKVMGVVAQALASVADGMARMGGNNNTDHAGQMYKQLNEQIERDVQRQREAIEGRNKDVAMKLTGVGLAKTALGNVEDAVIFESRQKGMRFANELKAQAARTGSDAARAEMLSAAAKLEADAAQKDLMLQERLVEQKMRSRVGSGSGGGGAIDIASIRATIENQGTLTTAQLKAAKDMGLFKAGSKTMAEIEGTPEGDRTPAEQAAYQKAHSGGTPTGDLIDGYEQIPGTQALDKGNVGKAREIAGGAAGVRRAGNRLAETYAAIEAAMAKGDTNTAESLRTQYGTEAGQFMVMKSLAGGQGTITSGDAERDAKEGGVPPPPGAPQAWIAAFSQKANGLAPSAGTIRNITRSVVENSQARLEGYNLRPRTQAPAGAVSAEGAARQGPAMVTFELNGKRGAVPAAKAAEFLKKYPNARQL